MKILFKNEQLSEQYKMDGFVVIPFISEEQIQKLKGVFKKHHPYAENNSDTFFYSLLKNEGSGSIAIKEDIEIIFHESLEMVFKNFNSYLQCFLAKPKGEEEFNLHQDWSYTDEEINDCATLWCPLDDVTINNGCLFAVKGSHRLFKNLRSGSLDTVRLVRSLELEPYITAIEIKKGEAVIFHPALFHGSFANKSEHLRIIAASIILPENTGIQYFHGSNSSMVEQYKIEERFYFDNIAMLSKGNMSIEILPEKVFQYVHYLPSESDLITALNERTNSQTRNYVIQK